MHIEKKLKGYLVFLIASWVVPMQGNRYLVNSFCSHIDAQVWAIITPANIWVSFCENCEYAKKERECVQLCKLVSLACPNTAAICMQYSFVIVYPECNIYLLLPCR